MKQSGRIEFVEENPELYPELLRKVLSGEYALLDVNNLLILRELEGSDKCDIRKEHFHFSRESFLPAPIGLPMRKGWEHSNTLNWRLLWYLAFGLDKAARDNAEDPEKVRGLFSPIKMQEKCEIIRMESFPHKGCPSETPQNAPKPLSIQQMIGVFMILGSGLSSSMFAFMFELCFYRLFIKGYSQE